MKTALIIMALLLAACAPDPPAKGKSPPTWEDWRPRWEIKTDAKGVVQLCFESAYTGEKGCEPMDNEAKAKRVMADAEFALKVRYETLIAVRKAFAP